MTRLYIAALVIAGFTGVEKVVQKSEVQDMHWESVRTPEKLLATNDSLVLWTASRKLTWNDFQGVPDSLSEYRALTSTNLKTKSNAFTNDLVDYELYCVFEKNKSWTLSKSSSLLQHEQIHFDISELVMRKMRRKFLAHKLTSLDSVNVMINKIFQEAVLERRSINYKYDTETEHGTIAAKQKIWEDKIAKELKALNAYSSTRVVIKRVKK